MNLKEYLQKVIDADDTNQDEDGNEDFNPCDMYGGNFDDAYYGGERNGNKQGQAELASKILSEVSDSVLESIEVKLEKQ